MSDLSTRGRVGLLGLGVAGFVASCLLVLAWFSPPSGAPAAGPGGGATVTGADPLAQSSASPAEILQGLVDARATAVTVRDVALLDRAEVRSSSPHGQDTALIERLGAARQAYAGLRFAVHDVRTISRGETRMELSAVVSRDPYMLVGDRGSRLPQPASPGESYRYRLTRTPAGWRLADLTTVGVTTATATVTPTGPSRAPTAR